MKSEENQQNLDKGADKEKEELLWFIQRGA